MTRLLIIASFLVGTAALSFAQTEPQSLGEVARQNKKGKKAAIVLNDDNMRRTIAPETTDAPSSKPAKSSASAEPSEKKTNGNQAAPAPQGTAGVADLEKKVASYKAQEEGWKSSAQHYQELLSNEPNEFRRQMYQDALSNDQKNAVTFKQKAEQAQAELAKARESANKTGKEAGPAEPKEATDNGSGH